MRVNAVAVVGVCVVVMRVRTRTLYKFNAVTQVDDIAILKSF